MAVAKKVFSKCSSDFTSILEKETGKSMESNLTLSEFRLEEVNEKIIGGVFLRSNDGVIVCDNSIDSRVRLIFEQLLPTIRGNLFPKPEKQAIQENASLI
jgi:V-type H+-transporting ATPase subunit E